MRLSKNQIEHMAFTIVKNLLKEEKILVDNRNKLIEDIANLITEEFQKEDKLDQEVREILSKYMEKIRRLFTHNALVLDIGSGLGYNLNTLHKHFSNIVAADISLRALKHSKEEHASAKSNQ